MVVFFCVIIIPTPVWVFDLDFNWGVAKINYIFIFLLVMPKYWGKQNFRFGSIPEVGQKHLNKTMDSFTFVHQRKPPGPKRKKSVKTMFPRTKYCNLNTFNFGEILLHLSPAPPPEPSLED